MQFAARIFLLEIRTLGPLKQSLFSVSSTQCNMKKIDKLVLNTFLALFSLTFCVAFFVLLMQFFLLNSDMLLGKGLGWAIYIRLASYVGVSATQQAFPLAILLASLMTMGNLGEHLELTALKSAGISLSRVLRSLFLFVALLSVLTLVSNCYVVPRARLRIVSLLHDLGKKKPSVAIKEGVFYDGVPGYSIKVGKKLEDKSTLQGVMIYDHTKGKGNLSLTTAELGKMYTIHDEAYMVLELFDGHNYVEDPEHNSISDSHSPNASRFYQSTFKTQKLVLSLDSFKLTITPKEQFAHYYRTKNIRQLSGDVRTIQRGIQTANHALQEKAFKHLLYSSSKGMAAMPPASVVLPAQADILQFKVYDERHRNGSLPKEAEESPSSASKTPPYETTDLSSIYNKALSRAVLFNDRVVKHSVKQKKMLQELSRHKLEQHKMIAWAMACMVVLLVGAPLGAVVKKGGVGAPLIIAVGLIVWHYIFDMLGEKWANEGLIYPSLGAWMPNGLLLSLGILFLRQAYRDTRLFEIGHYVVLLRRAKKYMHKIRRQSGFYRGE